MVDEWKNSHEQVMLCYSIADLLNAGISLYSDLNRFYGVWEFSTRGCSEDELASPRACIENCFRRWLGVVSIAIGLFEQNKKAFNDSGFDRLPALEMRVLIEDCQRILGEFEVALLTPSQERLSQIAADSVIPSSYFDEEW